MLKIYNSLTRRVENFIPLQDPHVGMYTCGPTVYDFMHIGNLRTFTFSDILHRVLKANGYEVTYVQNITDIDDKIIKRAKERGISIKELADEYTWYFLEDIYKLNILPANVQPKATEHIGKMIKYIEELIKKGLAYVEKDGSVYFDISRFTNYGQLSQIEKRFLKTGTRILSDEYSKDNVQDFALWKVVDPEFVEGVVEDEEAASWDSPWGKGRPGWHIECSVMSEEYLSGERSRTIDIHAGGIDLLFPHHENEIAQSEGKSGKKFANYFVHGEHMLVNGQKMSKSLKNFYTLKDLVEKGFDPLSLRYLYLTAHYKERLNFTFDSLTAAQSALNNLCSEIRAWEQPKGDVGQFYQRFMEAANNDLSVPQAVAIMWELVKSELPGSQKSRNLLEMDKILGLGLEEYLGKPLEVPKQVMDLVNKRETVRKAGDFKKADELRKEIKKLGFIVEDTPAGPKLK